MPLQKLTFKPGVNRENTRYTTEGGWYESDKVRFRQGTPEKIGGWRARSASFFLGICRTLWAWVTLGNEQLIGLGTNLKVYVQNGGLYFDITPLRLTNTLGANPFSTNNLSVVVGVTDGSVGAIRDGDFVTFTGATAVAGLTISGNYQITLAGGGSTYTITASSAANATTTGGGSAVIASYEINTGPATDAALVGWGAGTWGSGTWGTGGTNTESLRVWTIQNFGQDAVYGPEDGPMYYWNATVGYTPKTVTMTIATPCVVTSTINVIDGQCFTFTTTGALPTGVVVGTTYYVKLLTPTTFNLSLTAGGANINTSGTQSGVHSISPRMMPLTALANGSDVPTVQSLFLISAVDRFLITFGANDYGSTVQDPMLIRWADQESLILWTPAITNQAGSIRLSHGSQIIAAVQTKQEILVWTDSALYAMQYVGPPYVWSVRLVADNTTIISSGAAVAAGDAVYWMGRDKFYVYNGRSQTLRCDLQKFIFDGININQADQCFASTVERYTEVWFFYCETASTTLGRYAVYNYTEDAWTYGTMTRTAWMDSGLYANPIAATYTNNLVDHESGVDNGEVWSVLSPIEAYITSSEFDIGDGHNFGFVWRLLPDVTFVGSDVASPTATMYLLPLKNSGSGYNSPLSVAGSASGAVTQVVEVPIETFTGQINIRVRGRQMAIKIASTTVGTAWQIGSPRIDVRPDGRRG